MPRDADAAVAANGDDMHWRLEAAAVDELTDELAEAFLIGRGHRAMIANLQARFDHRTIRYYLAAFRRGAGVAFALLHRMALDSVMAEPEAELEYKQQFILRVTKSRTASGMKQWQIAEAMGIPQDRYKQYETGA
jgi:hypothetical protein